MSIDINKHEVDIDNLFKQNELDLCSIKELYRKLKELEKKISQIKYIDSNLADKLKKDYESLKRIILDENIQAKLTNDINEIDTSINTINNDINIINSQMDSIKNLDSFFESDVLLIPSYRGFLKGSENLELYISNDCKNCYNVNTQPIYKNKTGREFYDYCGMIYNGKFYFIADYRSSDAVWGGDRFAIISTSDFITFDEHVFNVGNENVDQTWAPEFFVHNNEVYIFYCMHVKGETFQRPAISTVTKDKFSIYYSKATDNTLKNWTNPQKVSFDNDESKIDPCVIYKDNLFHMFVCRDTDIVIDHYTSSTITGVWQRAEIIDMPCKTEAPAIVKFKNKYYMFLDSFRSTGENDEGLYHVLESTNLYNWSNLKVFKNQSNNVMRHFSPIVLKTEKEKNIIKNLYNRLNNNQGNSLINTMKYIQMGINKHGISFTDLGSLTNTGIIEELKVQKNTIYYLNGIKRTVTIKKINIDLLENYDEFHFIILVGNRDLQTKIVIMNSCTGNGTTFLPLGLDYITMGGVEVNNSIKYSFFVKDKFIRCNLLPNYIFETKPYIPYNFIKNSSFTNDFTDWSNMSGITQEIVNEGLKSEKSCHLSSTSSEVKYKGIYQNIELLESTKYDISCYYLVKDKSSFNNNFALEVKARKKDNTGDSLLGKKQITITDINDYMWTKINLSLDTSNIDFSLYKSYYIYFYIVDLGNIYVTDFTLSKSNSN